MSIDNYSVIVDGVNKSNGFIDDDHDPLNRAMLSGIALLHRNGDVTPVGLFDDEHFSLNEIYLKDGKVRLSRRSVGGLMFRDTKMVFGGKVAVDLVESVVEYNSIHSTNEMGTSFLTNFYKMRLGRLVPVKLFEEGEIDELKAIAWKIDEARRTKLGSISF